MSSGQRGKGRRKIEMKKMSKESNLQVTFSKRRNGLFNKANELCTLCGVDIALVVFSPSGKVFSFVHPNIDKVIDRYFSLVPIQNNSTMQFIETQRNANVYELNIQLSQINNTLDEEKMRGHELSHLRKAIEAQFWWACPIEGMNRVDLDLLKKALKVLKKMVAQHANGIAIQEARTQTHPTFVGNASLYNVSLQHQQNLQQAPILSPPQFYNNSMLQPHLFGFNNMGEENTDPQNLLKF